MSTDTAKGDAMILKADRRTVDQLLAAAQRDTDAASVFMDGCGAEDSTTAIIVIKGNDHIAYLVSMLVRQGMLSEGKPVDGALS